MSSIMKRNWQLCHKEKKQDIFWQQCDCQPVEQVFNWSLRNRYLNFGLLQFSVLTQGVGVQEGYNLSVCTSAWHVPVLCQKG